MKENKIIKKFLIFNILIILITPFLLEGLIGFNRKMNKEFGYGGKLNSRLYDGYSDSYTSLYSDFEPVVFPVCVILILLIGVLINYKFYKNYIGNNWLKSFFKFDFVFRILIIVLSALSIYQFNLTGFWDSNIVFYRMMYLIVLILPLILVYEFIVNKGMTVFPELLYKTKQQSINSDEKKLESLNKMNIISDDTYSAEVKKISKEKKLIEIRNSATYKEFKLNIDFAVSKGLLSNEEKTIKLKEKEQELLIKQFN